jgi:putative transposase
MVTAATRGKARLLKSYDTKEIVRSEIASLQTGLDVTVRAWVILEDHYHILLKTPRGDVLPTFFRRLHGRTAFAVNTLDGQRGRQVWHNYWDTCIRTEADFWTRFNYIHYNPVKHGYVRDPEQWEFSSLGMFLERKGRDWVADVVRRFPPRDFTDQADRFPHPDQDLGLSTG